MSCINKWCSWIQAFSQIAVAIVIVYAGIIVNKHMESWTTSFERGSGDLHSIRNNMNNIAYSMESINNDMDGIKTQMNSMSTTGIKISNDVSNLTSNLSVINKQLAYMNYSVKGMRDNFSPKGMARTFMPF
jgi:methyl-accepting chemotaxis protein